MLKKIVTWLKLIVFFAWAVFLFVFAFQLIGNNQTVIELNLLGLDFRNSIGFLFTFVFCAGFALGLFAVLPFVFLTQHRNRRLRGKNAKREDELKHLRALPVHN